MTQPRALLILHGKQAANDEVRAAVLATREAGRQLDVRVTWEGGDARRLVEEGLAAGYTTLIAGGGDAGFLDAQRREPAGAAAPVPSGLQPMA